MAAGGVATGVIALLLGMAHAADPEAGLDPAWRVDRFGARDGLPLDHLNDLTLDGAGYLWITTFDGLTRFDGHQFRTFRRSEWPALRSNRVVDVVADTDGRLVFSDELGTLYRFDPRTLPLVPEVVLPGGAVELLAGGGVVWARGDRTVWRIGATAEPTLVLPPTADRLTLPGGVGADGSALILSSTALFRVRPDGSVTTTDLSGSPPGPVAPGRADAPPFDDGGAAWVAFGGAVRRVTSAGIETPALGAIGQVCGFGVDAAGVWVDTDRGTVRPETSAGGDPDAVSPAPCAAASLSTAAGIWHVRGERLYVGDSPIADLGSRVLRAVDDAAGGVWLATHQGLVHVRPAAASAPEALRGPTSVVSVDADGGLWVGMEQVFHVPADGAPVAIDFTDRFGPRSLRRLRDGRIALVGRGARWSVGPDLVPVRDGDMPLGHFDPGFWKDTADAEWIGGDGLYRRARGEPDFAEVRLADGQRVPDVRDVVPLDGGRVAVLAGGLGIAVGPPTDLRAWPSPSVDLRGALVDGPNLWLATEDRGLCRVPTAGGEVRCASEAEGLGDHNVHDVRIDARGRLWLGTNRGVLVVERAALDRLFDGVDDTIASIRLDERDGMPHRETNGGQWAVDVGPDGALWYATMAGPARLDPGRVPLAGAPEVRLDAVTAGGRPVEAGARLDATVRELRAAWSVPEFVRPEQVQFRYRLGDGPWQGPDGARAAVWTNIPPGPLALTVQARLGGDWGEARSSIVERAPTFLETPAFPLAIVLATAGATAGMAAWWGRARRLREVELAAEVARRTLELRETNSAITRQKATLEAQSRALAEADAAKTRFVANLSHELRTPMMLVLDPLQELAEDPSLGPAARRVRIAARNAERLRELVDQLFDVVRLDAGRIPLRARRLDAGAFVHELGGRFAPVAESRGISLRVHAEPGEVWADPDLLEKILGNLVGNALKFVPAKGRVDLSVTTEPGRVRFVVQDDGPGVPEAARALVFDRFYQGETGRRAEGAGIGLALARELAELHGGALDLVPSPRGARFELGIPSGVEHLSLADVDLDASGHAPAPSPADGDGRPRVLVVEDHAELLAWLVERLSEELHVEGVPDATAALARVARGGVDLVLSDIMLPGMDGLELCRNLRADPRTAALPVVLMSAKGAAAADEAERAGASAFVPKPIRTRDLLAALRAYLPVPVADAAPPGVEPDASAPTGPDAALLGRVLELARAELTDPDFGVERLARRLAMSPRTLQRTLNRLTGRSPTAWLQELRLEVGREALRGGASVAEAAAAAGVSPSYFARLYGAWFGYPPSREAGPT